MKSASPSDLTGRARIRDAAIELFAEEGFARPSLKAIAEAAGVSPALVIHHYGSKEGLRRSCDDHVTAQLLDEKFASTTSPSASLIEELLAGAGAGGPMLTYVARLLVEPGGAGHELFAKLLASTEEHLAAGREAGTIHPSSDPGAAAVIVTAFGLAPLLLRARYARALGADPFSPEGAARLTVPTLEILTEGLYAEASYLRAARSAQEKGAQR